jgi:hypothetical protein
MKCVTIYLQRTSMVCPLFPNYNGQFITFSTYTSLKFVARFTCLSGDKAGFHAIEGYWAGVTAN